MINSFELIPNKSRITSIWFVISDFRVKTLRDREREIIAHSYIENRTRVEQEGAIACDRMKILLRKHEQKNIGWSMPGVELLECDI